MGETSSSCSGKQQKSLSRGKQIEEETGVKITIPSSKKDHHIGATDGRVTKASEKIATVLDEAVKSPSLHYSHFISLPLAIHPELVDKLQKFQNAILGCNVSGEHVRLKIDTAGANSNASKAPSSVLSDLGIDKSIFIKPKTFHLTVLMLKLWNKDRVAAATEVLQKISSQVNEALDNRPVFVKLEGLLHATLMNAGHRNRKMSTRSDNSFDARGIFSRYGAEKWGDHYLVREAHLSQRFMFDECGYYHCCASIPFPEAHAGRENRQAERAGMQRGGGRLRGGGRHAEWRRVLEDGG